MKEIKSYRDLIVWQKAHSFILLVYKIYKISKDFPADERFGITSQLRRAATSIGLNIVEGKNRGYTKEFVRFLYIARGSCQEAHYLLYLCKDLNLLSEELYQDATVKCEEITKMINGLINSLKRG